MESFRKVIKGWLGKVLLVLFLIPLALVGIEGYFSGGSKDSAKKVNGDDISKTELDNLTKSFQEQYAQQVNGDETLLNQEFIQNKALDTLVLRTLLLQQADKLGISLSDAQIEQMIMQQPSFQENGQFSKAMYEQYLSQMGFPNSESFLQNLRQDHALKMMTTSLMGQSLVSDLDVKQIARLQTEQRTLHVANILLTAYKAGVTASAQEIQNYYNKNLKSFKQMANADVDYVLLSPEQVVKQIPAVTDEDLKSAYAQFVKAEQAKTPTAVKHILLTTEKMSEEQVKTKIADIAKQIKGGLTFDKAAAQYSEDSTTNKAGGVIEGYQPGIFGTEFDTAVSGLKEGQVSAPIKTPAGYHLILRQAQQVQVPSLESQKARLTEELTATKAQNAFSDVVNSLNEMVVDSDDLGVVTQEYPAVKVVNAKAVKLTSVDPVLGDRNVKTKIFNDDVKNGDRNVTSSIQLENGQVVWLKVRNYHAAGEQSLTEATPRVKQLVIEEKARAKALADIQSSLDAFKKLPAQQALAQSKIKFAAPTVFSRSQGLVRNVERAAFSLATPKEGMWSVTTTSVPNELVVVAVSKVDHTIMNNLAPAELNQLKQLYQGHRGQQEFDDYSNYLKAHAKIK